MLLSNRIRSSSSPRSSCRGRIEAPGHTTCNSDSVSDVLHGLRAVAALKPSRRRLQLPISFDSYASHRSRAHPAGGNDLSLELLVTRLTSGSVNATVLPLQQGGRTSSGPAPERYRLLNYRNAISCRADCLYRGCGHLAENEALDPGQHSARHLKCRNCSKASCGETSHTLAQAMNSVTSTCRLAVSQL